MLPASNRGVGMNVGFPDVCNTIVGPATAPIPYPNIGMNAQAAPFSATVKVSMVPALNMASKIPMTMGDEAAAGAHPTIKGMGSYTMGNPIVFVEYMPAINLLCPTTGNNMNNPLGAVLVPSVTNVFFTFAGSAAPDASIGLSTLDELQADFRNTAPGCREVEEAIVSEVELLDPCLGSMRIHRFTSDVPSRVRNAILQLMDRGMKGLVIDLRGNPGGDLDAALRLADDFLEAGVPMASLFDGDGDLRVVRSRGGDPYPMPLAILVDRQTASAAELFAGALASHGRASLFGEETFGKCTMQRLVPSERVGARWVTVGSFALETPQIEYSADPKRSAVRAMSHALLATADP